ncbi:hypothetical protein [Solicola sp. PLA-1-18]|uniref:hypothetical protein n=1 Tax=Solicola sp. PLA-1-18 TaxID=3380532 RepID=UPI003B800FBA
MTRPPLPHWGEKAKTVTKIGGAVWGLLVVIGWALRALIFVTGTEPPVLAAWMIGVPAAAGASMVVLGGLTWLVAEFATGLREPPQPD